MWVRALCVLFISTFVCGCGQIYKMKLDYDEPQGDDSRKFYLDSKNVHLKAGKPINQASIGLALSGGGIRSAGYSLGVIKQLSDSGVLEKVDIISSVSGGGYTAYWLFNKELQESKNNSATYSFGKSSLSNDASDNYARLPNNYVVNTCSLMGQSKLFTLRDALSAISRNIRLSEKYRQKIVESFGDNPKTGQYRHTHTDTSRISIHELKPHIESGRLPNWVINTTVRNPKPENGILDGTYEITPFHSGNSDFKFINWRDASDDVSNSIAISGAAEYVLLSQKVDKPNGSLANAEKIKLSDGGHSENLGVLSLIRRKIPHIIVVDGEQDKHYTFEAYFTLKKRLNQYGLDLQSEYLDCRLPKSNNGKGKWWAHSRKIKGGATNSAGTLCSALKRTENDLKNGEISLPEGSFIAHVIDKNQNNNTISTLYYNKLSKRGEVLDQAELVRPESGFTDPKNGRVVPVKKRLARDMYEYRETPQSEIDNAVFLTNQARLCHSMDVVGAPEGSCNYRGRFPCETLRRDNPVIRDGFVVEMLKQNALIRIDPKVTHRIDKTFPMRSTADQSYKLDQFSAYMGLGYMQSEETCDLYRPALTHTCKVSPE